MTVARGKRGNRDGGGRGERGHHEQTPHIGESLRDLVVSKVAEKAAERDRSHRQGPDPQAEALDVLTEHLGGPGPLDPGADPRGRRPRLNRDEIAATAVRIADAEGLAALSMRRLATELGAGTMTLYHYVRTKDELLTLVIDTIMGEVIVPDGRAARRLAGRARGHRRRTRATLRRHPWILDIADDPPIGPNSVRHFDQTLQAVSSLDAPLVDKLDMVDAVDEYVFGTAFMDRQAVDVEEQARQTLPYIETLLETGAFPHIEAMVDEHGIDPSWATFAQVAADEGRFERNLRRLLAGVAADFEGDRP